MCACVAVQQNTFYVLISRQGFFFWDKVYEHMHVTP